MAFKHPCLLQDFNYIGLHHYSLTWPCEHRKPFFAHADRVELVRAQLLRAAIETEMAIVAYCFMPDHLHQLVKGLSASADGRRFIKLAKQYSGYQSSKAYGERVFQRYGHDRWLRQHHDPRRFVLYIIDNPVVAGLVDRPDHYPFTGSQIHTIQELMQMADAVR